MLKRCIIIIFIIITNPCVASENPPQIAEASCPAVNNKVPYAPFEQLPAVDIARLLGWVRDRRFWMKEKG